LLYSAASDLPQEQFQRLLANLKSLFDSFPFSNKTQLIQQMVACNFYWHELYAYMVKELLRQSSTLSPNELQLLCLALKKIIFTLYSPVLNPDEDPNKIEERWLEKLFEIEELHIFIDAISRFFSEPIALNSGFGFILMNSFLELVHKIKIKTTINYNIFDSVSTALKKALDFVDLEAPVLDDHAIRSSLLSSLITLAESGHSDEALNEKLKTLIMEVEPQEDMNQDFYRLLIRYLSLLDNFDYALWNRFKSSIYASGKFNRPTLLFDAVCLDIQDPDLYFASLERQQANFMKNSLIIAYQGLINKGLVPENMENRLSHLLQEHKKWCGCWKKGIFYKDNQSLAFHRKTCLNMGSSQFERPIIEDRKVEVLLEEFEKHKDELLLPDTFRDIELRKRICQYRLDLAGTFTKNGQSFKFAVEFSFKKALSPQASCCPKRDSKVTS